MLKPQRIQKYIFFEKLGIILVTLEELRSLQKHKSRFGEGWSPQHFNKPIVKNTSSVNADLRSYTPNQMDISEGHRK